MSYATFYLSCGFGGTAGSIETLDDFRSLRLKVAKAALSGRRSAYYLDTTWEARLPGLNTQAEPHVYQRAPTAVPSSTASRAAWPHTDTTKLSLVATEVINEHRGLIERIKMN